MKDYYVREQEIESEGDCDENQGVKKYEVHLRGIRFNMLGLEGFE
ncbi:MAG: hypothetical protein WC180_01840 [Candidatus Paceibacterota bacterium]